MLQSFFFCMPLFCQKTGVIFISFEICVFVVRSVQVYPAVFLTHFISAAVILHASFALMVQFITV